MFNEKIMSDWLQEQLLKVTYGPEIPMTEKEVDLWKPIFFEVSGTWGADVKNGGSYDFYQSNKWIIIDGINKRRVYGVGSLAPACRSELFYGVLHQSGPIPITFHKEFNRLVDLHQKYIDANTCMCCGYYCKEFNHSLPCANCGI